MSSHKLNLTSGQAKSVSKAIETSSPVRIKLTYDQLNSDSGVMFPLTNSQKSKIEKSLRDGKGVMINFSKNQVAQMKKQGGILPALAALIPVGIALLSGAAGAVGTWGTKKLLDKVDTAIDKKKKGGAIIEAGRTGQTGGRRDTNKPPKYLDVPEYHSDVPSIDVDFRLQRYEKLQQAKRKKAPADERKKAFEKKALERKRAADKIKLEEHKKVMSKGSSLYPLGSGRQDGSALFPLGVQPRPRGRGHVQMY